MSNELLKTIDALVEQKTFNLDALDAIKSIRDKAAKLESDLKEMESKWKSAISDLNATNIEFEKVRIQLAEWKKRDEELCVREKEADIAIYDADKHKAVSDTYKNVMDVIFRPNVVRETIQRSVPVAMQSGCNGTYSSYIQAGEERQMVSREEG